MYVNNNPKTKKELMCWVKDNKTVTLFAPGLGAPRENGWEAVEGPHYPQPHKWYAQVLMKDGRVTQVK